MAADDARLRRPLRHLRLRLRAASTRGPRSTAPTARSCVTLVAEPQRRVYVRRINVAGNTRTRDEVVRREFRQFESSWYDGRQDQAVARPRRPPRLLQRGQRRHHRGAGLARPGRPDDHDQGKADRQPARSAPASRRPTSSRSPPRSSRRTSSARATTSASRSTPASTTATLVLSTVDPYFTIDGISRAIDVYYRTSRPINSQGEEYKLVTPGRRDPLRRAVQRVRHGVLRHRRRAHRDQGRRPAAEQLLPLPRAVRRRPAARCR